MAIYLLSGLSGSGKTTIGNELAKLGYEVVNTDEALGYNGNVETGEPVEYPEHPTREWFKENGWIWDGAKLEAIVQGTDGDIFLCGGSRNEAAFYPLIDKIFLLHVPDKILEARLRARNDPRTSSDLQIQRFLEWNKDAYGFARKINAVVVETDAPLEQSVTTILSHITPKP